MLKLPTYKDLGINIKKILWENNYQSLEEFKHAYNGVFCAKLGHYLHKMNKHTSDNFLYAYNVIFYYGYINQKREQNLLNLLTDKGFNVKPSFLILDAIVGIDLIASKDNITYVIQVKPNDKFNNIKHIKTYANNHHFKTIFAYKIQKNWYFLNENMLKISIF